MPTCVNMIGSLPPPKSGMPFVTLRMVELVRGRFQHTNVIDVSAGSLSRRSVRYHALRLFRNIRACVELLRHRRHEGRTLYLAISGSLGLAYDLMFLVTARCFGFNMIVHHHSYVYIDQDSVLMRACTVVAGPDAVHLFLSEDTADSFQGRYPRVRRRLVLPNTFVLESFQSAYQPVKSRTRELRIGLLSNLSCDKGLEAFVETGERAVSEGLNVTSVLAGPLAGPRERAIVDRALERTGERLRYIGPVYGQDKENFYRDIDVFVFPTAHKDEAQSLVVLEALASGVPVISYERGCIGSMLADGGVTVPVDDNFIEIALTHLKRLHDNRRLLEDMSRCARERFEVMRGTQDRALREVFRVLSESSQGAVRR